MNNNHPGLKFITLAILPLALLACDVVAVIRFFLEGGVANPQIVPSTPTLLAPKTSTPAPWFKFP